MRPEPKEGESYREFVTQTSRLTQSQHAQLYCAFGLAQVYAHDRECRMFFLDLDEKGRQLVKQTLYAPILDAFVLELEQEEKGAADTLPHGVRLSAGAPAKERQQQRSLPAGNTRESGLHCRAAQRPRLELLLRRRRGRARVCCRALLKDCQELQGSVCEQASPA